MSRAYVDTNVILRFLTGDPPEMAAQARALFAAVERGEVTLIVDEIVVAEVVWVLESYYGHSRSAIGPVVQELVSQTGIETADRAGLLAALNLFVRYNVDFADALVAVRMGQRQIRDIYSFDRHFDRLPGVTRHSPGA